MAATESLSSIAPFRLRNKESDILTSTIPQRRPTENMRHCKVVSSPLSCLVCGTGSRRIRSGSCGTLESRRDSGTISAHKSRRFGSLEQVKAAANDPRTEQWN